MIRPCDTCGGSGIALVTWEEPCPRCVDMPRVKCRVSSDYGHDPQWSCCFEAQGRFGGWFKPDPDSVMGWCPLHRSVNHFWQGEWSGCHWKNNPEHWSDEDCPPGTWVAAIAEADRLEEA